jgi:hypothetical protein
MRIKKMVKRLFAVGAGATMLGATAMGALAADLGDYPSMFVSDGVFNGILVVGDNSQPVDILATTDIAANMKYNTGSGGGTTSVAGDAWLVGTSSKKYEMATNNATDSTISGENWRSIVTFIGDEEMDALADGAWVTNEQEYDFQQFLFFDVDGANPQRNRIVKYSENDDDETGDHLFIQNGRQIARYRLEFSSTAQSDVTDSGGTSDTTGTYLDDFENTDLSMLGNEYSVVLARRTTANPTGYQDGIKLTLMSGSTRDTLLEGETQMYTVGDKVYDVTLTFTDDDEAKFTVNGESTSKLKAGETYVLSDKSEIGVSEVLYQAYAGGVHSATFFVGASKVELRDDAVQTVGGGYNLKVGSEDIDGTTVIITGTDNNVTFTVSTIEINMTADDDYFVGPGEKLSDVIAAAGEEKEVLMDGALEIEYHGLSDEATRDLSVKSSSSRRYKVNLFDGDGNAVSIPVAYAEAQFNLSFGEESWQQGRTGQKRLHVEESDNAPGSSETATKHINHIAKNDYFVVTGGTAADGSAKSYLLQYKGADRQTKTSPKIKFKNTGSGETLEYSVTSQTTTGAVATIKLGGYSFVVHNRTIMSADDFQVMVDLNGGGTIVNSSVDFVDYYGSAWNFTYKDSNSTTGAAAGLNASSQTAVRVFQHTPNGDDYDNIAPSNILLNITAASGPEVRAAFRMDGPSTAGINGAASNLVTPDGETEVAYGYTSMGTHITFTSPSGDPNELTLMYPENQRLPQVYFTSGATTTSTSKGGSLAAVEVGVATKLASEVADATAQNAIVVGGPCVNSVAAELLGNPADCTSGFTPGKARVKLFSHTNGKMAMLVAGYTGADTRLAGTVIANRWRELSGMEVEIEGTTSSDATIGAPSPVVGGS